MGDEREFFEGLVYHSTQGRRFTQQSPVMPDVWIHYGMNPGQQLELLMEPDWHHTPANLARVLAERLGFDKAAPFATYRATKGKGPAIASNQNVVAARLWFDQLVRAALPLSAWWKDSVARLGTDDNDETTDDLCARLAQPSFAGELATALANNRRGKIPADVIWLARVTGLIAHVSTAAGRKQLDPRKPAHIRVAYLQKTVRDHKLVAAAFIKLIKGIEPLLPSDPMPLYSVNRNRTTSSSLYGSVNAIKADAAQVVFTTRGAEVAWAVVDSGIDATHFAFRKFRREGGEEIPYAEPFPAQQRRRRRGATAPAGECRNNTRIVATYDFVHIRELLGAEPADVDKPDLRKKFPILNDKTKRAELKRLLSERNNYAVDWDRLEPFLVVNHGPAYRSPVNKHGTHVAGIIGADWRMPKATDPATVGPPKGQDMAGVAPGIALYDFRVLDDDGNGSEFAVMSALQFIRDLNNRRDYVAIHGVNLSFSIPHDVANYACGRTPVCEETERLVGSGVVVVAAAGNSGRARYITPSGTDDEGFRTVSITDPGNAASVITVGSTHRTDAHTYGVSYFSSRGPTGDGRLKPDLVAPGEKIRSTVPGNEDALLDGTSMAAPHVSGAAALLIGRHREFVGQPQRIKQILCTSATDLGRERYFQGAGLLDILRALQSI